MKFYIIKNLCCLLALFFITTAQAQYFSEKSNSFGWDTKSPSVYNWCPEAGVWYLPGQEVFIEYSLSENNLVSVELGFSFEEGGEIQVFGPLPDEGPVYVTIPDVPTSFAKMYIIAKDSFGHVKYHPIPFEGYFHIGAATQIIGLPQGWSGISTAYVPENTDLASIFADYMGQVEAVMNMEDVWWPDGGVMTLQEWNTLDGYFIKTFVPVNIEIHGSSLQCDQWGSVKEGWDLLPIPGECDLDAEDFFWWNLWSSQIIREAVGWRMFWPQYNIATLEVLERGRSYYVHSSMANNDFVFTPCWEEEKTNAFETLFVPESWSEPVPAPQAHVIAIPEDVTNDAGLSEKMTIGAFNSDGKCAGVAPLLAHHITVFGDDPTTEETEGMQAGELMQFRIWDDGKEISAYMEFDPALPQSGPAFQPHGISAALVLKTGDTGLGEHHQVAFSLQPNPATKEVILSLSEPGSFRLEIIDGKGSVVLRDLAEGVTTLSLESFQPGIYFVKLFNRDGISVQKLMIN